MTIRKKILLLLFVLIPVLTLGLYSFLSFYLSNGFDAIEQNIVSKNAVRVRNSVDSQFRTMAGVTTSEANWDDAYNFIRGKNPQFAEKNLTPDALANVNVNYWIYTDMDWNPVGWAGADITTSKATAAPVPQEILDALKAKDFPWKKGAPDIAHQGFLMLPGRAPLAMTSDVVLMSDATGSPVGYCILARYVDQSLLDVFKKSTIYPVNLKLVNDPNLPPDYKTAYQELNDGADTYTGVLDEATASGYVMYRDIDDLPAFIMRLDITRDIYRQQQLTLHALLVMFAIFGIVTAVAMWLMTEMIMIRRLALLSDRVKAVLAGTGTHTILAVSGSDEVSYLSEEIAQMLERVDEARMESEKSRDALEKKTADLEARTNELETMNKLTIGRELKMIELKKQMRDIEKKIDTTL